MKIICDNLQDRADEILEEIIADEDKHDWFWPKTNKHEIFEQARMKFVNRNLNYFSFPSIIAQVKEGNEFNPALPKTLDLCRYARVLSPIHTKSPFGRMCVWNLPPGKQLLPHRDNYSYHRFITRNIFIVSDSIDNSVIIKIENQEAPSTKGSLWQFHPDVELHTFHNTGDKPFYFLGFDFWDERKLAALQTLIDHKKLAEDPIRMNTFGGDGSSAKYISKH
jgi:hypothetical protein